MEEQILIKKAQNGCNDSFDKLIKDRGKKLYKVAYCYVKNEQIALDIVSEATFKAYISIHKLKKVEFFDTWLMKIVINEALTAIKKQKKIIYLHDYKKDIEEKKESIEENMDLYKALDELKKDDKEILVLKYFADLTFLEISKMIKKPENTVKTKHYRALEKVKKILEGEK